ncbi:MAG: CBS domain-containing protein [Planctomycetota bacterium]|nr:CBS domain-containing protein [Planctomycetota bacterium]
MGEQHVREPGEGAELREFVRALLEDVQALELMLERGMFECDVRRIGAEQEVFLVDEGLRPSKQGPAVLERLGGGPFTTELGIFNIEANLPPLELGGDCLSRMERLLNEHVGKIAEAAREEDARVVLCGILPTMEKAHLGPGWMTPVARYRQLGQAMREARGSEFRLLIKGLDELQTTHDSVMLEACNTSFQIHFQVGADEFVPLYNLAQVVTAPVLAAAVNSPVFLQHRLWHETRVALFQQSLDMRSETQTRRGQRQRVSFGERWVKDSVLEIYREDISRFRVLLATAREESPLAVLERGEVPLLKALCLHNSTVYRWNRPCYGVKDGVPHLRIETRVLPAGPTILDEVANAAFFNGLMLSLSRAYDDVTKVISFDEVKGNFTLAARYGLQARFHWTEGRECDAKSLILKELLPLARTGLAARDIDRRDIDRYLGVIGDRVESGRTGARWALDSLAAMGDQGTRDERYRTLTAAYVEGCEGGQPVHVWDLASLGPHAARRESYRTVGQIMTREVFTVHPDDLVDFAASLMDWEHVRHVPVEDERGRLVGILTHRQLLRMIGRGLGGKTRTVAVGEIMQADPVTVTPDTGTLEAVQTMRGEKVGCLPVVEDGKLVGIVSEHDFIDVAADLLDTWLSE